MKNTDSSDQYSDAETERRRDAIVKRMIETPPTPHAPIKGKKKPSRIKVAIKKPRKTAH